MTLPAVARPRDWSWLAWLAILGAYAWFRYPLIDVPLDRDEGAFGLIGQGLLRGDWPYVDLFDHKPPGVFFLYALALRVFGASARGVHLFLALWNLATLLAVWSLARALFDRRVALWTAWFFALVSAAPAIQAYSASTEMLLPLPLALSLRTVLMAEDRRGASRAAWLLASGALGAFACWIKQPAALPLLTALLLIVTRRGPARRGLAVRECGVWIGGGLALSLVIVAVFAARGALGEMIYWTFTHNIGYGGKAWPYLWGRILPRALALMRDLGAPVSIVLVGGAWAAMRRARGAWIGPVFLVLSLLTVLQSPYLYRHYFAVIAPALSLAAGFAAAWLTRELGDSSVRRTRAVAAALILLSLVWPAVGNSWFWLTRPDPNEILHRAVGRQGFEMAPRIAAFLRERMDRDDWMFIYGSEPQIPLLADRRDVNPYVMLYPLTGAGRRESEFQRVVWDRIQRVAPKYFLVVNSRTSILERPNSDPFLARKLERWTSRGRIEAMVLLDEDDNPTFVEEKPRTPVSWLYQIWRLEGSQGPDS